MELQLWPIRPRPQPDELLTSWIVRTSRAYGMRPHSFCELMLGENVSVWNRDFDRSAPSEVFHKIATSTGLTEDRIFRMTLRPYLDGDVTIAPQHAGLGRWLLPMGIYHRTRKNFAQLFCPRCLAEDPIPYFRRRWRLAFYTVCDIHDVLMYDRCPVCASPVMFHRGAANIHVCAVCRHELSRCDTRTPPIVDIHAHLSLRALCMNHDLGWSFHGALSFQYSHQLFDVLYRVCCLLVGRHGERLFRQAASAIGFRNLNQPVSPFTFETCALFDRYCVLQIALWLLSDWPIRFIDTCKSARVTACRVVESGTTLPYWFQSVVDHELNGATYSPQAEEVGSVIRTMKHKSQPPSRCSIAAALGKRQSTAICDAIDAKLPGWPTTAKDFDCLIDLASRKVKMMPRQSVAESLALRDLVILCIMKSTGWHPRRVLELQALDLRASTLKLDAKAAKILRRYIMTIRPMLVGEKDCISAFPGARSSGIQVKNFGVRLAKLRQLMPSEADGDS